MPVVPPITLTVLPNARLGLVMMGINSQEVAVLTPVIIGRRLSPLVRQTQPASIIPIVRQKSVLGAVIRGM